MKKVAFVPIKLNSERIKNKNILKIGKKPLCYYIFESLKDTGIQDIYVYCSDEKIKNYIPSYVKYLRRNKNLDKNETKGMEIYTNFCSTIKSDVYVLAHATSPFTKAKSIKKGLNSLKKGHDSSLSVKKIQTFAWYKNSTLNYSLDNIPRTQNITPIFIETSGFYIFTKDIIYQKKRIGDNPFFVEVDNIEAIDVDEKEDLKLARKIINNA